MLSVNVEGLLHVTRAALVPGPRSTASPKFGVTAFSESLRQELQPHRVRVGVIEPGTVDTELASHPRDGVREAVTQQITGMQMLHPRDISDAVSYMVTRDRRVAVNEMLVRPSEQTW